MNEAPDRPRDEPLLRLDEIRAAAGRLRGIVVRTPLLPFGRPEPGDRLGRTRLYLKPESLQPMGAFKLRGAYNALVCLSAAQRERGVVSHSSGNHAQGVSRAARLLDTRALIVMPSDAPRAKVAGVRADGAEIVFVGPSADERVERAHQIAEENGLALIPSFDDRNVMAGQGTIGLEIVEQLEELEELEDSGGARVGGAPLVLVPIGGGGLASGIATAVKSLLPDALVIGVEPALAADAQESLRSGRLVRWDAALTGRTSADGMRTPALGLLPFGQLRRFLADVVTVDEDEIAAAMASAARNARLVLEPSGATALAAWLFHRHELPPAGRVVTVLSGGNVDPEHYRALLERGARHLEAHDPELVTEG